VKCPKCNYLGFETGDRCRNCGYDFSLIGEGGAAPVDPELELRDEGSAADPGDWLARIEAQYPLASDSRRDDLGSRPDAPAFRAAPRARRDAKLPLFAPGTGDKDDGPLIKLPAAPRAPLAVRRTPDSPRLRAVPQPVAPPLPEPSLAFDEEARSSAATRRPAAQSIPPRTREPESVRVSGGARRAAAAVLDLAILGGIDVVVVYLTVRMTSLTLDDWATLPLPPLLAFLALVKVGYFVAFTSVGGQTIGKMAAGIRVVGSDGAPVTPVVALRRTLAGAVSAAVLGLGFVAAFFDPQQRALHDRVARTRVVGASA
jgi:uncharacterized RDD family membrane protein YckC